MAQGMVNFGILESAPYFFIQLVRVLSQRKRGSDLPARLDWSIIGWTIRRRALINLWNKEKANCNYFQRKD